MKLSAFFGAVLLALAIAGLVITNPGPDEYARYATEQASTYLGEEVCTDLPSGFGSLLMDQCLEMTQSLQPQLETMLSDRTQRLNLGVASLYRTSFAVPEIPMLPKYRVETLGILKQFITYRVAKTM